MATLEHFFQPQPFDAPHTDHGERATQTSTSPRMEEVVTQLAATHNVDLSQKGANFQLDVPDQHQRWMIANLGKRISVTRCQVDKENGLAPDLDMVFAVTPSGWEPHEIIHAEGPWDEFAQAAQEQDLAVFDEQGDLRYKVFTEFWAQQLGQQDWLAQGRKMEEAVIGLDRNTVDEVASNAAQHYSEVERKIDLTALREMHKEVLRLWYKGMLSETEIETITQCTFDEQRWHEKSVQEQHSYQEKLLRHVQTGQRLNEWLTNASAETPNHKDIKKD